MRLTSLVETAPALRRTHPDPDFLRWFNNYVEVNQSIAFMHQPGGAYDFLITMHPTESIVLVDTDHPDYIQLKMEFFDVDRFKYPVRTKNGLQRIISNNRVAMTFSGFVENDQIKNLIIGSDSVHLNLAGCTSLDGLFDGVNFVKFLTLTANDATTLAGMGKINVDMWTKLYFPKLTSYEGLDQIHINCPSSSVGVSYLQMPICKNQKLILPHTVDHTAAIGILNLDESYNTAEDFYQSFVKSLLEYNRRHKSLWMFYKQGNKSNAFELSEHQEAYNDAAGDTQDMYEFDTEMLDHITKWFN